jgi:hypothetical protein
LQGLPMCAEIFHTWNLLLRGLRTFMLHHIQLPVFTADNWDQS